MATKTPFDCVTEDQCLYRGSATPGLTRFRPAEEYTLGTGVYFTSSESVAEGYAKKRTREIGGTPTVYYADVTGLKFIDLREDEKILGAVMDGFYNDLLDLFTKEDTNPNYKRVILNAMDMIGLKKYGTGRIKNITFNVGDAFTTYLNSLGYDGLIAIEGGEGDIPNHDTWLVFDPSRAKLSGERIVA